MSGFKESKLYSILNYKCPRCHEGEMFPPGTLYSPRKFSEMNKFCTCCGQDFVQEPGYYYGAMYVSFGMSTGIFFGVLLVLSFLVEEITFPMVITAVLVISIGLMPVMFRLSRAIWINIFIHYEGPCSQIPRKKAYDIK
jgi:ribosomal protein S27AE